MTTTGLILGPLLCLAALLPAGWLLLAAFAATVFADGAIINAAGKTVSVGWFGALLIIGRVVFDIATGRSGLRYDILVRLLPLWLFVLSCFLSLILALALFRGEIIVLPGSAALNPLLAEPYRLMPENLNQLVYLVLTLILVCAVMHLLAEMDLLELDRWTNRAMRLSCGVATAVIVWQIASIRYGIPFPSGFFHSDLHSEAWSQSVGGVQRPSGPFPEPSALAYFYASYLFYFWQRLRSTGAPADQIWLIAVLAILLMSTSTAAYALLAVFAAYALCDAGLGFARLGRRPKHDPGFSLRLNYVLGAVLTALSVWVAVQALDTNADLVRDVVNEQIVNKKSSSSYKIRSNADDMAKKIFLDTYGLGVGVGSHRPSSGLLALLCGPGALGTALFLLFIATVVRPPGSPLAATISKPIRWAAIGLLLCHVVTGPEFHNPQLWLTIAVALAMHRAAARVPTGSPSGAGGLAAIPSMARRAAAGRRTIPTAFAGER